MDGGRSGDVDYPDMRFQVVEALRSLSDLDYQHRVWGKFDPEVPNLQDSLDLNIHILYDDCAVLPHPKDSIGPVLHPEDVGPLERLEVVLGPLIDSLGDSPDATYLADPRWPVVVSTAREALITLERHR